MAAGGVDNGDDGVWYGDSRSAGIGKRYGRGGVRWHRGHLVAPKSARRTSDQSLSKSPLICGLSFDLTRYRLILCSILNCREVAFRKGSACANGVSLTGSGNIARLP
jgi:hypothetical protein